MIPWNEPAEPSKDMCKKNTDRGGASNYSLVMMITSRLGRPFFLFIFSRYDGLIGSCRDEEYLQKILEI
jgi:hypothetical protein